MVIIITDKKVCLKKMIAIEHWKYCYEYNQTFINELNSGNKYEKLMYC